MRLIDADSLETHEIYEGEWVRVVYADDIDNAPTVDAEPVVHCGECKYYPFGKNNKETRPWCKIFVFEEPRYCSYGKRREDG